MIQFSRHQIYELSKTLGLKCLGIKFQSCIKGGGEHYYPLLQYTIHSHKIFVMSSAKHWCFTCNNYTDADLLRLRSVYAEGKVVFLVWSQEVAPETGTPHLQGYVALKKQTRLAATKKILGIAAHLIVCKGSPQENYTYCTKGGVGIEEFGTLPVHEKGKRSDLSDFQDAVKSGILDKKRLREEFPDVCAKYPRYVMDYVGDHTPRPEVEPQPLYEWQQDLYDYLKLPPSDREIIFVVDKTGNRGKTWFAKYYCQLHENAQFMEPSKKADMAMALQDDLRVLFVNVTRQQQDHFQYSFFEALKDGMVFSPKYESRMRYFKPVHIVVMMNQEPDMKLLSADRYKLVELN